MYLTRNGELQMACVTIKRISSNTYNSVVNQFQSNKVTFKAVSDQYGIRVKFAEQYSLHISKDSCHSFHVFFFYATEPTAAKMALHHSDLQQQVLSSNVLHVHAWTIQKPWQYYV